MLLNSVAQIIITFLSFSPSILLHVSLGLQKAGNALMITVPMDTMSVAAVVLIANVTTIRSIIETLGTEPLVEVVVGVLVHLVQVREEPL